MYLGLRLILSILFLVIISSAQSQTVKLSGKILNGKNEALPGVSVKIIGTAGGTTSDIEGRFSLGLSVGKKYELEFTAIGYTTKNINDVEVLSGQVNELNIVLEVKETTGENVVVTTNRISARRETTASLITFQKNTSVVAQVISAEAIRRSPDKNTGEVLKRAPGTSVIDGKYLVVRGLADRYNQAMLNGVLLSSTEPDRKTFSFDLFPSTVIDNIIINKTFIPELSGEWAGGLVQITTNDVPNKNFLDIQIGTGFNTQTIGNDFYKYKGGKYDFLGFDDGTRGLPDGFPMKSAFNVLSKAEKTEFGKQFNNIWSTTNEDNTIALLSRSLKLSGGFNAAIGKKNKLGAIFAINYNLSPKRTEFENRIFSFPDNATASVNFDYFNNKYAKDVLLGGLANFTLQLGSYNKISIKNIFNINTTNYTTKRTGKDYENDPINGENIRATELAFKANTFFNTQITGDHSLPQLKAKLHWYGSFNILDQYIPDQRRIQYNQNIVSPNSPYLLLVSASSTSQRSGSRYYGFLNDYNYNAGGDINKDFKINDQPQSIKAGYFFQVKDRLFDSRPFAIYIPAGQNPTLQALPEDQVFSPDNFGDGFNDKFAFNEISDNRYRYIANSILNAGFLQFDNQFAHNKIRLVWGARLENYDQLLGSVKQSDPRHLHTEKLDVLPGINFTYKLNSKTNIRLAGSQTVIRPEFRELSSFAFYDFDLGATVTGNPSLNRTKITNADVRYELYPRAGELFTLGLFYKYFQYPTELFFNNTGAGASGTFNYISPDKATSYGVEFEFRKKLDFTESLRNFTLQGNLSYIYNRVPGLDRPMQGQSPYLINFGIQYDVEKLGLNTTVLFNQIGRRIYYVGGTDNPPVWEAPRPLLDFQIAKKILKNKAELKLNLADIINQGAKFYHDLNKDGKYNEGTDALAIGRTYGTNISFTFGYSIK